eukprot:448930-Prorocentrum_minimum.AAC.2
MPLRHTTWTSPRALSPKTLCRLGSLHPPRRFGVRWRRSRGRSLGSRNRWGSRDPPPHLRTAGGARRREKNRRMVPTRLSTLLQAADPASSARVSRVNNGPTTKSTCGVSPYGSAGGAPVATWARGCRLDFISGDKRFGRTTLQITRGGLGRIWSYRGNRFWASENLDLAPY